MWNMFQVNNKDTRTTVSGNVRDLVAWNKLIFRTCVVMFRRVIWANWSSIHNKHMTKIFNYYVAPSIWKIKQVAEVMKNSTMYLKSLVWGVTQGQTLAEAIWVMTQVQNTPCKIKWKKKHSYKYLWYRKTVVL